ncbi:TPA: heme-binding protein [Pseudomonas aeruginosa]|uniref:GlcG/HbpS family heme-binding protein n=1 Tax=Pseudomonas aeruginosa TaxID=287 RepID=UPI0021E818B3|nr:heme-binding protein [Pseudomonas aeruginosa]MCV3902999.1 heme-binding protein [Pseudomonas aeruginosa]HBN9664618.1 heme-binding protein [Pseudomonas aeruginosa]HCE6886254.1 heme-binding protein [Pseudomonas aeruginosa]
MSHALNESTIQHVIERAQALAREQHFAINIAIVDEAGLLRGFLRMNDAVPGAIDVSIKKARTAALFRTDSLELGAAAQPGGAIYTLEATNGGLISFGGGVVLRDEDRVIGAVGVAGATVEADQAIALYAASRV